MRFCPSFYLFGASPLPLNVEYIFLVGSNILLMMAVQQWVVIVQFSAWVELCQFVLTKTTVWRQRECGGQLQEPRWVPPSPSARQLLVQLHAVELRACAQFAAPPWPVPSWLLCLPGLGGCQDPSGIQLWGSLGSEPPGSPNVIAISKLKLYYYFSQPDIQYIFF